MHQDNSVVSAFRAEYQANHVPKGYHGALHLSFTLGFSCFLIWLAWRNLNIVTDVEWLAIPATLFYNNLVEYLGHKGPMHHKRRLLSAVYRRHTRQHNRYFTHEHMTLDGPQDFYAVLFPPILVVFFVGVFGVPMWFLLDYALGSNVAWLVVGTSAFYFLNYELFHLCWHMPTSSVSWRVPGLKRLGRLHTDHHDPKLMASFNFNISWPVSDWLFGTFYRGGSEK